VKPADLFPQIVNCFLVLGADLELECAHFLPEASHALLNLIQFVCDHGDFRIQPSRHLLKLLCRLLAGLV